MVGKTVDVLVEQDNEGYTANYIRAKVLSSDEIPSGTFVKGVVEASEGPVLIVK